MINILTLTVSEFQQNCRLILDQDSRELIVIDPGADAQRIAAAINYHNQELRLEKVSIVLTHLHIDHAGGVLDLSKFIKDNLELDCSLMFHKDADQYRESIEMQAMMYGLPTANYKNVPEATEFLDENSDLRIGDTKIKVLHTPGHAIGHISLFIEVDEFNLDGVSISSPCLIAGDALFRGSIGRTDLPGGDHQQLINSIKEKLLVLPGNTTVLCGHGPHTTIEVEKSTNYFLLNAQE